MITFAVPAEEFPRIAALPPPIGRFLVGNAKLVEYGQFADPLEIPPGTLVFTGLCHFLSARLEFARQIERQLDGKPGPDLLNRPSLRRHRPIEPATLSRFPAVVRVSGPGYLQEECVETEEQFHHLIAEWTLANYEVERISVHSWPTGQPPIRTYSAVRLGGHMKNVSLALTRTYPLDPSARIQSPEAMREDETYRKGPPHPGVSEAFDFAGIEFGAFAYLFEDDAVSPWLLSDDLATVLAALFAADEGTNLAELAKANLGLAAIEYQPDFASTRDVLLNLSPA